MLMGYVVFNLTLQERTHMVHVLKVLTFYSIFLPKFCFLCSCFLKYSRLSLSQSPRDSLNYFEISVSPHIRFTELRKKDKLNNHISQMNMYLTPENRDTMYTENIVEKRRNCSLEAVSPLFHIILLPVVIVSC